MSSIPAQYKRTKFACYFNYPSMAAVFSLPPMLFLTFREMYGISYTLLGTLVLVNFCTQLTVDLIFSFFTKYFNIQKTVCFTPLICTAGFLIYCLVPALFPQYAYAGLVVGTLVFSIAAGLSEALISPTLAAIPGTDERDMSFLHSMYAWGVLAVILISTLYFQIFGRQNWLWLALIMACLPIITSVLFFTSSMPEMDITPAQGQSGSKKRTYAMALCVACIFMGSAAENTMTNWISSFVESALSIPKAAGDVLGMAAFISLLGLARVLHSKYGGKMINILLVSMIAAVVCYLTAAISPSPVLALIACVLTGFFTSLLWPGTLILMEEQIPGVGVAAYALMAAGGDFGGSIAPQMMGIIVDSVSASEWAVQIGSQLSLAPEQVGMKVGMLAAAAFPVIGTFLLLYMKRYFRKNPLKS
ncbi:MAG: MFS transporter [Clostridia bacterium]|nr:MFS transporter [Clostridia bacterium]